MINDENEMVDLYIPRKWCVLPATEPSLLWPARTLGSKRRAGGSTTGIARRTEMALCLAPCTTAWLALLISCVRYELNG